MVKIQIMQPKVPSPTHSHNDPIADKAEHEK
jgi:hypothetical protein